MNLALAVFENEIISRKIFKYLADDNDRINFSIYAYVQYRLIIKNKSIRKYGYTFCLQYATDNEWNSEIEIRNILKTRTLPPSLSNIHSHIPDNRNFYIFMVGLYIVNEIETQNDAGHLLYNYNPHWGMKFGFDIINNVRMIEHYMGNLRNKELYFDIFRRLLSIWAFDSNGLSRLINPYRDIFTLDTNDIVHHISELIKNRIRGSDQWRVIKSVLGEHIIDKERIVNPDRCGWVREVFENDNRDDTIIVSPGSYNYESIMGDINKIKMKIQLIALCFDVFDDENLSNIISRDLYDIIKEMIDVLHGQGNISPYVNNAKKYVKKIRSNYDISYI